MTRRSLLSVVAVVALTLAALITLVQPATAQVLAFGTALGFPGDVG